MEEPGSGYQLRSRIRVQDVRDGVRTAITRVPGQKPVYAHGTYPVSVYGEQKTVSRDNRYRQLSKIAHSSSAHVNSRRAASMLDIGGNFISWDNYLKMSHRRVGAQGKFGYTTHLYSGPFMANGSGIITSQTSTWPKFDPPTEDYLFGLGANLVGQALPTNSSADLAVALAELVREGLPDMFGKLTFERGIRQGPQSLGNEYLNYQFGIKPLINDTRKFADAVLKADALMRQYERDSGRQIRRRSSLPSDSRTELLTTENNVSLYPTLDTTMYTGLKTTGVRTLTRTTRTDVWFSGAFRYMTPYTISEDGGTVFERDVTRARLVYGVKLDAEVLWNLAPWSWFADWFVNIGQVIHNLTAFSQDGLVMRYGYLMYRKVVEDCYEHSGVAFNESGHTGRVQTTFGTSLKRRVKAHPFGFGLRDENLTPRQWAILAALGITSGGR